MFLNKLILIICILLGSGINRLYANDNLFKHYETNTGLSSNQINCIAQDKLGFMWIGTANGLNRFDGTAFITFKKEDSLPKSLGNNYIDALHIDLDSNLWVGTHNGLYLQRYKTEQFELIKPTFGKWVTKIVCDKNGFIWFTCNGNLSKLDVKKRKIKVYRLGFAYTLTCTEDNAIWTSDNVGNLVKYDGELDRFTKHSIFNRSPRAITKEVQVLIDGGEHLILVGTKHQGIKIVNAKTGTYKDIFLRDGNNIATQIHNITEVEKNIFWVGTSIGLFVFDAVANKTKCIKRNPLDPHSLSDNDITSIKTDHEGGVWVGTKNQGLNYYNSRNNIFERYIPSSGHNYNMGLIRSITTDEQGNAWAATSTDILKFGNDGAVKLQYSSDIPISALLLDGKKLWIGKNTRGVEVVDAFTHQRLFSFGAFYDTDVFKKGTVNSFFKLMDNTVLIATTRGLYKCNPQKWEIKRIKAVPESINVSSVFEDGHGNIWIGSNYSGLFFSDRALQKITAVDIDFSDKGKFNNTVTSIAEDKNENIWISCEGRGIFMINGKTKDHINYTQKDGLPTDNCLKIMTHNNQIWVSTSAGLCVLSMKEKRFITFTQQDGLLSNQFCENSGAKSERTLFFGSTLGLVSLIAEDVNLLYSKPVLFNTNFMVNNQNIRSSVIVNKSQNLITKEKPISLSYDFFNATFSFNPVCYASSSSIMYSYRIDGLDTLWTPLGNSNKVLFTRLRAGTYTLMIKASNVRENWTAEHHVKIIVRPAWWFSNLAYALYFTVFCCIAFMSGRFLWKRNNERHKRNLERWEARKDRELYQAKINFFTLLVHEIRTPLTLIKAPIESLAHTKNAEQLDKYINLIKSNAERLLQLVTQLLDFRKIEQDDILLSFTKTEINTVLKDIIGQFEMYAESRKIEMTLVEDRPIIQAFVDLDAFKKIISNLITNALKHAERFVHISLNTVNENVNVEIRNDGPPIPLSEQKKIFEPFYRAKTSEGKEGSGLGLPLAYSLAKMHKGNVLLTTENTITVFKLSLPIHQSVEFEFSVNDNKLPTQKHVVQDKPYKILIVEDDSEILSYLADELSLEYNVSTAENGASALKILEEQELDLVISDVAMPKMDGFELCHLIKSKLIYSHIPFVILSALYQTEKQVEGLSLGADVYIEKPFAISYLRAQISSLLQNRRRIRQSFSSSPQIDLSALAVTEADNQFVQKLNEVILANINDPDLDVDYIAEELCMTRRSLYRKIQGVSDLSPSEMITVLRLKRAAELIVTRDVKMFEVAEEIGYKTRTSFTRSFTKQFGISPTEYAKKFGQGKKYLY